MAAMSQAHSATGRAQSIEAEKPNALQIFHVNFNCSDLDRSRAFYESIGFQEIGRRKDYYKNPVESGIVMKFLSC